MPSVLAGILIDILVVWNHVWWIVMPVIAAIFFWGAWEYYLHVRWFEGIKWKLLEIKIPKNVLKTPKAMEQIFAAAHAPYSYGFRFFDKYWKGLHEDFFSFELVGRAGETHFYLRLNEKFRNMMESAIYGQYPEAEITEVDDYLKQMPAVLPNKELDLAGFEEVYAKPNPYPIRTYPMFEDPTEERRIDPIASFVEALSKLRGDQQFWLQLIIQPTGEDFVKEGQALVQKLLHLESEDTKKKSRFPKFDLGITAHEAARALFEHPGPPKEEKKKDQSWARFIISPGEKEITEGISKKIAKFGFETTLRFVTIYPRSEGKAGENAVMLGHGYIRQFNTQDMNALRPDRETTSASYAVRGLFKKTRLRWRKRILYERYRHLTQNHHKPILNIEELATIFHFPIMTVATSELEKVESRKGTPPAALPIVED